MTWSRVVCGAAAVLLSAGWAGEGRAMAPDPTGPKIADDARNGDGRLDGMDFEIGQRLQRAWLVLHYRSRGPCTDTEGDDCELDAPVRVSLPGLTYDSDARAVVYRPAGAEPVVCATVRRGGFPTFRSSVAPTGRCTYRTVKVDRILDDGFDGQRDRREEVHFAVRREGDGRGG